MTGKAGFSGWWTQKADDAGGFFGGKDAIQDLCAQAGGSAKRMVGD